MVLNKLLPNAQATVAFAGQLAGGLRPGMVVYLSGEIGAGKTTLVQGILAALGYVGVVKSPTFTLVESYVLDRTVLYHFDLYRVVDPEELELIGIRDYLSEDGILLFEWAERGGDLIPPADLIIRMRVIGEQREIEIEGLTSAGVGLLQEN